MVGGMDDPARTSALIADWPESASEAITLQRELASRVETDDRLGTVTTVAGLDVSYSRRTGLSRAAVVVLRLDDLTLLDSVVVEQPTCFPYIPGLLSFREVPPLLAALEKLRVNPDLLLCDGQGLAHPRRFGLACHLGVLLDRPAIGVAKSRLIGDHEDPGPRKGDWSPLRHKGEVIGAVLRSREKCRPLYVSSGHRVDLETAIGLVLACTTRYRLPETTRAADRLSREGKAATF